MFFCSRFSIDKRSSRCYGRSGSFRRILQRRLFADDHLIIIAGLATLTALSALITAMINVPPSSSSSDGSITGLPRYIGAHLLRFVVVLLLYLVCTQPSLLSKDRNMTRKTTNKHASPTIGGSGGMSLGARRRQKGARSG
ncbi:hypothetical protein LX32DRAFT_689313 [Colletotrichum zoysiae]|uniref:Uncharacterized protein n=1 Tax=Colletotrichum zoysiae TaxID=1216348 RepID=A0AAD9HV51_9PEZI|nr:hypothetical protein LX32DRAFT_689313 [Colletotrichum zoysiae]